MKTDEHKWLLLIVKKLPEDYQPFGKVERWADPEASHPDCSTGCRFFRPLHDEERKSADTDWGVCTNPNSHRTGLLTFEHQGCFMAEVESEEE